MKILFTGGGTGGHIFPIIALSREMRRYYIRKGVKGKSIRFYYIGPRDDLSLMLLSQEGIKVKKISAGKLRAYPGIGAFFQNIIDIFFRVPIGILQSFFYVFFLTPDLIFSKGGYGSIPPIIAGRILLVPVFIHESDVVPGKANRIASKFAKEIFVSFSPTVIEYYKFSRMILVGNLIRKEILEGSKEKAKKLFNLTAEKPVVLILGGSQGAQRINNMFLEIIQESLKDFEVIHQCGEKNFQWVNNEARAVVRDEIRKYYHLYPFLKENEIKHAYQAADFIVSRAGSGSIFEIAALGKPSILIPLPESAQNHQAKNAYMFAKNGGCEVLEEQNMTPHFFLEKLRYYFSRPADIEYMSKRAKEFSKPRAAELVAAYLMEYLTNK